MVELHGLWTLPPAKRIAEALKPFDVAWLEEPVRFNELDAIAELARSTAIPVAASERLATAPVFRQLINRRAASIIMIDLAWCGGISEARKIAAIAEAAELPVTLHDCTGPIVYAASCALSAALPMPATRRWSAPTSAAGTARSSTRFPQCRTATSHRSKALGSGWRCGPSSSNGQTRPSGPRALEERQSR